MVETMENGRHQTWTAANVAALMVVLLGASFVVAAVLWGVGGGSQGMAWKIGSFALVALVLAAGLWRRSKVAYWLAILVSSAWGLMTLISLPPFLGGLQILWRQATGLQAMARQAVNDPTTAFVLTWFACGLAMLIAFFALLSKSARREFGIGRFAALKKGS